MVCCCVKLVTFIALQRHKRQYLYTLKTNDDVIVVASDYAHRTAEILMALYLYTSVSKIDTGV